MILCYSCAVSICPVYKINFRAKVYFMTNLFSEKRWLAKAISKTGMQWLLTGNINYGDGLTFSRVVVFRGSCSENATLFQELHNV